MKRIYKNTQPDNDIEILTYEKHFAEYDQEAG